MDKIYNKLVRDNIPKIINDQGKTPILKVLDDVEYKEELEKKLYEEYLEVVESSYSTRIEELADMVEVISALAKLEDKTLKDVIAVADKKRKERGSFDKKVLVYFNVPFNICRKRNKSRMVEKQVPDAAFNDIIKKFKAPSEETKKLFDEVIEINNWRVDKW